MLHLVTAVVKPHKVGDVKAALDGAGVHGMTVTEVRGVGRQGGKTESYRGTEYTVDLLPKVRLEIVVSSDDIETITRTISTAAHTGTIGDGKVWVMAIDDLVRIRTGDRGTAAL